MSAKTYRTVPVRNLSSDELLELSKKQKLSLSREDMEVVQQISGKSTATPLTWNWK